MSLLPRWNFLYRGPLSSCNYDCNYCPFAKTRNTAEELRDDSVKLDRFVTWVDAQSHREIGVLFTPWGEALVHRSYQEALRRLSQMNHVYRATIQTNLTSLLDWVLDCDLQTLALWCTWHPTQITLERFLTRCEKLNELGVRYSVGVVGFPEQLSAIRELRAKLTSEVYLWVNAYKDEPNYYSESDVKAFGEIDPLFHLNTHFYSSLGKRCQAGTTSFSVDGDGTVQRCHFIKTPIGNLYRGDFESTTTDSSPCSKTTCECHIGYVNLEELKLDSVFGDGILERIPRDLRPTVKC